MSKLSVRGAGKERESRLLVIGFIVLFLALNLVLSYLAQNYGWYFLATDRLYYTLSGVTDEYFEKVNPNGYRVELYFCSNRTALTENNTFGRILDTVEQFDARYDFFTATHLDTYYDYETLERFAKEHDTELNNQSVILYCPDTGKSEVRSLSSFYYFDAENTASDDMIFKGEEVVASLVGAVVSQNRPTALFTKGHGELPTTSLLDAVYSAGFAAKAEDISVTDIPADTALVIIACPKYDFEEYADASIASEVSRLRAFVRAGGTVLYLRDPSAGALTRLDAFCADYGITAEGGMLTDATHSVDRSGNAILLRYAEGDGAAAVRDTAERYNTSRLAAAGASALRLGAVSGATAVPLLQSYPTAELRVGGESSSMTPAEGYTVAALSTLDEYHGKRGRVAVVAADAFATVDTMETDGYGNKEFLFSLLAETTDAVPPIGCGVVLLNTYPLEDMTRGTAGVYLAVFGGAIPLFVALAGVFVLRRRGSR